MLLTAEVALSVRLLATSWVVHGMSYGTTPCMLCRVLHAEPEGKSPQKQRKGERQLIVSLSWCEKNVEHAEETNLKIPVPHAVAVH